MQKSINVYPTPTFEKKWKRLKFTEADLYDLAEYLEGNPDKGKLIKKTGGFRKLRWPAPGNKGKRSGVRIIYYYKSIEGNIFLHGVYLKKRQSELRESDKKLLKEIAKAVYFPKGGNGEE